MNPGRAALIAAGGMVGAALRWLIVEVAFEATGSIPWGVLAVNVGGSALLAWAIVAARRLHRPRAWLDFIGIGFCGGVTTFSAFAVDSAELLRAGDPGSAAMYVALSVVLGIGAAVAVTAAVSGDHRTGQAGSTGPGA
jgi:CrcB protein